MSVLKKYWRRETKTFQKMSSSRAKLGMKGGDMEAVIIHTEKRTVLTEF